MKHHMICPKSLCDRSRLLETVHGEVTDHAIETAGRKITERAMEGAWAYSFNQRQMRFDGIGMIDNMGWVVEGLDLDTALVLRAQRGRFGRVTIITDQHSSHEISPGESDFSIRVYGREIK